MPLAIIGVGCRFPGGVNSSAGLWDLLVQGRDTVGPVPRDRWDADRLGLSHDPELAERASRGCFLDGDIWAWDPEALSVAAAEQRWVDPQFRLLMEVAWEAIEHGGLPMRSVRGSRTGVFVGTYAPDNLFREARPAEDAPNSPYLFGNFTAGAAGRIAFAMDLRGPVMVVSTHCSSGLVAVDAACSALTLDDCDMALAGAALLMVSPETHLHEAPLLLSPSGACHAFDARADGYVRGEGAAVLVIKRLQDARRDGDRVLAVIRGSAVNNDGQASRLTAPSAQVQQQLFAEAVHRAGIDPGEVGLVEAHGAGTAVGDPVEYTSINAIYGVGTGQCALGSIKTNIGHNEPVSGIAGTIKAIECLRRGQIPPNLHFQRWHSSIDRDGSRLFVPTELTSWPVPGGNRLAAVCSYGVTGTNAHLVLEAPPTGRPATRPAPARTHTPVPIWALPVSGASEQSLGLAARQLADWLEGPGKETPLRDLAHTLTVRRSHAEHRACVIASDRVEAVEQMRGVADRTRTVTTGVSMLPPHHAGPVFVFTGQGSQRDGMCQGLLEREPVFAAVIDELDPLIRAESGFSVRDALAGRAPLSGVDRVQPTLFAVQVGLADVWRSWGVEPAAVIGQSLGEVAAAVVAGALTRQTGVQVICRRSKLLATISGGAMASVLADASTVRADIDAAHAGGVSLGVLTGPKTTVVSGDARQITGLIDHWTAAGITARRIDVEVASHSPQVDPILADLAEALADIKPGVPRIPLYSTVTDTPEDPVWLDSDYWVRNQREPVHFHSAVSHALRAGHRVFIECTAHPLAVRPILDTAGHDGVPDVVAVGSLREGSDDDAAVLTHLAGLFSAGYDDIDWDRRYHGELVDAPGTAWHRTHHGGDTPPHRLVAPGLVGAEEHPLLGGYVRDPDRPHLHWWQTPLSPARLPWLADHQVADVPVMPGTGYVDMMLTAAARVFDTSQIAVNNVDVAAPLVLTAEPVVTTRLTRTAEGADVEVVSGAGETVTVHARGRVQPLDATRHEPDLPATAETASWVDYAPDDLYRAFRQRHNVLHGPAFTGVDRIRINPAADEAVAALHITDPARLSSWTTTLHPALADQVVHVVTAVWLEHFTTSPGPVVVAGFDGVEVYGPTGHARRVHIRIQHADDLTCTASGTLTTLDGHVVARIDGLQLRNITPPVQRFTDRLTYLDWIPAPAPADRRLPATGVWAVIASIDRGWPAELAHTLKDHDSDCVVLTDGGDLSRLPEHCAGVVVALDDPGRDTSDPAALARQYTTRVLTVITELASRPLRPRLWIVIRSATAVPLAGGSVSGLVRTAAYEHPELRASVVHCAADTPVEVIAGELRQLDAPITEVAYRGDDRLVARIRPGHGTDQPVPATPETPIRTDGSYLVTGGLGGLGLRTVDWAARRHAGHVVIVGRSEPTPDIDDRFTQLRAGGTRITVVTGDIADPAVAALAVRTATVNGHPLRGVIHTAAVIDDAVIGNIDPGLLHRVWRGKADGAWALHQATSDAELDFFVVYSSIAALLGSPGQAAYAAANAFCDALVAHRRRTGLPASGIWWGAWEEVGRGRHLGDRGFATISPRDGIDALERILDADLPQTAYSPLEVGKWIAPYPAVRESTLLADLDGAAAAGEQDPVLRDLQNATSEAARRDIVESLVIDTVRDLLGGTSRHIGRHSSMVILGLDSLGAVQLQQRLNHALKVDIRPGVIWVKPTPADLASWLLEDMDLTNDRETRGNA